MPKKHVVNGFNSKFGNKDSLKLTFQHKQKNAEAKEDNLKEDPAVVVNSKLFGGVQKKKNKQTKQKYLRNICLHCCSHDANSS